MENGKLKLLSNMNRNNSVSFQRLCRRYAALLMFGMFVTELVLIFYTKDGSTVKCETIYDLLSSGSDLNKYPQILHTRFEDSSRGITLDLPYGRARLDNQRLIRIFDFIRVGNKWETLLEKYDICLTTQSSIERLYWVPEVLSSWNGPFSLAVLVVNEEEWLALNLYSLFLERCYPSFRDHVTIHLAVPVFSGSFYFDEGKLQKWNFDNLTREALVKDCNDTESYLNQLLEHFSIPTVKDKDKLALKIIYPQNHLRNIARKGCATHWTFSTDIDIIPRQGMAEMLQEFYENMRTSNVSCKKCAFVIPTFELDESKSFPQNKLDVIAYVRDGAARQYHERDYELAQNATDYSKWTDTNVEEGPTRVSHEIKKDYNSQRAYEPFYVSSDRIPAFDERFLGYGRTRSSQFQEALLAGWNFTVLTPVFSIHWGLHQPTRKKLTHTVGEILRNNQTLYNRMLFDRIVKELKLKHEEGLYK